MSPAAAAAAEATADTDFLGQPVSSALSSLFETRVQAMLADESDLDAQQAVVDRLREGSDAEHATELAAAAVTTSTCASASPASLAVAGAALTLASFAHALHRLNSFTLLGAQYGQLLDQLSWDLCDVLLPALQREWTRVASRTEQSAISDAQGGGVVSAESFAAAAGRPIASPVLTLLQHLLAEVFAHSNPRESALTLLSFYERSVHQSAEDDQDEDEFDQQTADDDADAGTDVQGKEEAEVELLVSHKSSSTAAPASTLAAFHRIALAFPLLDHLASLLPRISTKSSAAAAGSAAAASSPTVINPRQLELYQQLLGVMTHTMLQVSQRSEAAASAAGSVAKQGPTAAADRDMWVGMHVRLLNKCIDIAQPVLAALSSEAAAAAAAPEAAPATSSSLRASMLSFLFQQLFRFFSLYGLEAPELQSILDGNRAFAAKAAQAVAQTADAAATAPATSVTPHLAQLLSLLFRLCSCIDQCGVSPRELLSFYRHKRRLERAVEREELQQWEERGDGEWGADSGAEDDEDDDDDDGNAHDDEYDSQDGFGENAALQAFDSEQARKRKPPSALQLLRRELAALPSYNIHGIGLYLATAYGYQYFWRIKPARTQALAARNSAAAGASVAVAPVPDEPLAALLSSLPDIGARLVAESQRAPPRMLLDGVAPYLAGLLFHGLQSGKSAFVAQGIAMATGLWALLPPGAISIPERPTHSEGGDDGGEEGSLESSGAWILSESLLQCMYLCPASWPSLRSSLLLLWKSLLSCLGANTRFRLLQLSIGVCSVASVQAVILQRIKEEIVAAWNEAPPHAPSPAESTPSAVAVEAERASFLTPDLLASLHSYVTQAEEDFLASLDLMLAALNLFRFLFLRERADATAAPADAADPDAFGGRLGLRRPAVKLVWLEKWREVAATSARETATLDADIATDRAAADADTPTAKATIAQTVMLRNQVMMAGDLAKLAIEHLEE